MAKTTPKKATVNKKKSKKKPTKVAFGNGLKMRKGDKKTKKA